MNSEVIYKNNAYMVNIYQDDKIMSIYLEGSSIMLSAHYDHIDISKNILFSISPDNILYPIFENLYSNIMKIKKLVSNKNLYSNIIYDNTIIILSDKLDNGLLNIISITKDNNDIILSFKKDKNHDIYCIPSKIDIEIKIANSNLGELAYPFVKLYKDLVIYKKKESENNHILQLTK